MLTSKIFNTISAYLCSCSCQYCYHIKQKHCIFFSPKAFCDTQKVLKRRGLTTLPRSHSRLERGALPPQFPLPSMPLASQYRRITGLDYGIGIVGKCLGPTTSKGLRNGHKIFWYVSPSVTNVLCIVTLGSLKFWNFSLKYQFHIMCNWNTVLSCHYVNHIMTWQNCIWPDTNTQRKIVTCFTYLFLCR